MPLPLPNLDDRRWADLVDEGLSLIPLYAPEWTDHNIHDPGVALVELLAYLTEMDIYQLNRIPDRHKLKFMALVGIEPEFPRPARTVLSFNLTGGVSSLQLPATVEFAGTDTFGEATEFRNLENINIVPGQLQAVQVRDSEGFRNFTEFWQRDESFGIFGSIPQHGAELHLGFSEALPTNETVNLFFTFANLRSSEGERRRIIEESHAQKAAHRPTPPGVTYEERQGEVSLHHSVRTVWEFLADIGGEQRWISLDIRKGEVNDDTRCFTLDGCVQVKVPAAMVPASVGQVPTALYYLRCRFESGAYDTPPVLQEFAMNAVMAEQAVHVGTLKWTIAKGALIAGQEPLPGDVVWPNLWINHQGEISQLAFEESDAGLPALMVIDYQKPSATATGNLTVEAEPLGTGTGEPDQQLTLSQKPVQESSFRLFTLEEDNWQIWSRRHDFYASERGEPHFLLDPSQGVVKFGDGERGRTVPLDASIITTYRSTRAKAGNLPKDTVYQLVRSPHNVTLLGDLDTITGQLAGILNPVAATGGRDAETLASASGRIMELMEKSQRAVTLEDYETLAMETPGAQLARVKAIANVHPHFPCLKAPGVITLIIMPNMPVSCPKPSPGLCRLVSSYLCRRRVLGTRVEVVGPTYLEVRVHAKVDAHYGVSKTGLQQRIAARLDNFLHPMKGGPDGAGWPFGRDVYRSEVLQVIDEVEGVDHALSLELVQKCDGPQCGNVKLCPTWLVSAGQHQIEVM